MFVVPDTPPNITCVDFAVARAGATRPETKRFLYDPEENVTGVSLNDSGMDFNQYLLTLAADEAITAANVSISFDHGVRPVLAVPIKGACPDLSNVGALVGMVASMMQESGEFPNATPENDAIYHLALLTGRSVEMPEAQDQRP
ncbi:MAG: hypothetical protein K2X55_12130 [Burkholderiaceae bacterium]|nr:hypothetical protein [Burkholderiaceae bacterium]